MKILVDATGWKCREVNPHQEIGDLLMVTYNWQQFENTVQSYPLTYYVTPNSIVEAELVWQWEYKNGGNPSKWITIDEDEKDHHSQYGRNFRQAYQVSGVKEDEPKEHTIDFTVLELQVILKALKISKFYFNDETRTPEQDKIESLLICVLEDDYKIDTYNHSV